MNFQIINRIIIVTIFEHFQTKNNAFLEINCFKKSKNQFFHLVTIFSRYKDHNFYKPPRYDFTKLSINFHLQ